MKDNLKYKELKGLNDTKFKRAIGDKREIFELQVAILNDFEFPFFSKIYLTKYMNWFTCK